MMKSNSSEFFFLFFSSCIICSLSTNYLSMKGINVGIHPPNSFATGNTHRLPQTILTLQKHSNQLMLNML